MRNVKQSKAEKAIALQAKANQKRILAREYHKLDDPSRMYFYNMEADRLEARAIELNNLSENVEVGAGNEALPQENECENNELTWNLRETLKDPQRISLHASQKRLELLEDNDLLTMALDAADSIDAGNSLEKMLAHQMAACHAMALKTLCQAQGNLTKDKDIAVKMMNSSCRLMDTFQKGLQTMSKIRTGGRQVVTVQHVNIDNGGGQTVVAGNVNKDGGA